MYKLNGILMLEQGDVDHLKMMTYDEIEDEFDQTAITEEALKDLLDKLTKKAAAILDDAGDASLMMKVIISEGVKEINEQLAQLS